MKSNQEIANFLNKLAQLENLHSQYKLDDPEQARKYEDGELAIYKSFNQVKALTDAAQYIQSMEEPVIKKLKQNTKIKLIGPQVAEKIEEFSWKGTTTRFDILAMRYAGPPEVYRIPGIGIEMTKKLASEGIHTAADFNTKIKVNSIKLNNTAEKILEVVRVCEFPNLPRRENTKDGIINKEITNILKGDNKADKYIYNHILHGTSLIPKYRTAYDKAREYWETINAGVAMHNNTVSSPVLSSDNLTVNLLSLPIDKIYLEYDSNTINIYIDLETTDISGKVILNEKSNSKLYDISFTAINPELELYALLLLRLATEIVDSFIPNSQVDIHNKTIKWDKIKENYETLPSIDNFKFLLQFKAKDTLVVEDNPFWLPVFSFADNKDASNSDISKYLNIWRDLESLDSEGQPNLQFRLSAYLNASTAIRNFEVPLVELINEYEINILEPITPQIITVSKELLKKLKNYGVRGIGKSMAEKITWFVLIGMHPRYSALLQKYASIVELMQVEGVGASTARKLYYQNNITNLKELWEAANKPVEKGGLSLGAKPMQWLARYIAGDVGGRLPYSVAEKRYKEFERAFNSEFKGLKTVKIAPAGSYRRKRETVKDIDIVVMGVNSANIAAMCTKNGWKILAAGEDKVEPLIGNIKADIWIVHNPEEFGAALLYLTGSKQFNVIMRDDAKQKGYILNQRGLFAGRTEESPKVAGSETEYGIFTALDWPWIEPERREAGKFEVAVKEHKLRKQLEL